MNESTALHFGAFLLFGLLWWFGARWYMFFGTALVAIELDQAIQYSHPWWLWFAQPDTLWDLAAGTLGVLLALALYKYSLRRSLEQLDEFFNTHRMEDKS